NNLVAGNIVGLNAAGTAALGNAYQGVETEGNNNAVSGNVISANGGGFGGLLIARASGTRGTGNYIGTGITGTVALGNPVYGVELIGASNNTIGGTTAADRNIISGNVLHGVYIKNAVPADLFFGTAPANNNTVAGNYIGTDAMGTRPLGN